MWLCVGQLWYIGAFENGSRVVVGRVAEIRNTIVSCPAVWCRGAGVIAEAQFFLLEET